MEAEGPCLMPPPGSLLASSGNVVWRGQMLSALPAVGPSLLGTDSGPLTCSFCVKKGMAAVYGLFFPVSVKEQLQGLKAGTRRSRRIRQFQPVLLCGP